jgi:tRNA(Ile)-lysidine synthase TilS/MesJ
MFAEKYKKFKKTITDLNIIPNETKKIIIGMSGGKDASTMTHFLMQYQKQERPDIQLKMIIAPLPNPYWENIPKKAFGIPLNNHQKELLIKQKKEVDAFKVYWSQYLDYTFIPVQYELVEDRIMKMHEPCQLCFHMKMKSFHDYLLKQQYEDNTLFAAGHTKWDSHNTLLTHLLKSDGLKWHKVKERNPQKYKSDCIGLAAGPAYTKVNIGIPGKTIYKINPMMEFDDTETHQLSRELEIPIITDICKELYGDMFDQSRRNLSKYLKILSDNQKYLKLSENSLLYNYRNLIKFLTQIEILPPLDEVNGLLYDAFKSNFDDPFELLKR